MNTTEFVFLLIVAGISGFVVGFIIGRDDGRVEGRAKGRAEEWCEQYYRAIERDRARRGPDGKFRRCNLVCARNEAGNTKGDA